MTSARSPHRAAAVRTLLGFVVALSLAAHAARAEQPPPEYVLGVFPHLPPRDLEKVFAPMAKDLGARVGRRIALSSNTTYERFSENVDKEKFDIAFMQPFDYVRAADKFGYRPLATRTEKLSALVVVKQDSPLESIADLKGKRIGLPPETAAVSVLLANHLRTHGLKPGVDVTLSHHRSHVSCMQKVMIGEADACGTAAPAVRFFQSKMHVELKVVGRTREIPHTLFAIHPRVPERDREILRQRILSWGETEEGKALLARGELTPFVAVSDADYDVVRELAR
ncbi:phosphate ABC transporter [Sulfurifustis variabilis]|uniref:Phosphate ABC transporter n=1 Tax=Sulfurifustis variabilis TaxID=1675686 RepID=A0A1B4V200_9GAMM|nr:phosphate/phosphite/phosphonate ABC transporter substrate-binding protein [Sulfurifustis variabilis]BAU47539.1 phosphate ABC transporter [Sulfurifustis variabilis]